MLPFKSTPGSSRSTRSISKSSVVLEFEVPKRGCHADSRNFKFTTLVRLGRMARALGPDYSPAPIRSAQMGLFRQLFVWWENATPGTLLTTLFSGIAVGEDAFGNRYYQTKGGIRRWVIYSGTVEASRVPPDWHGWLHHTYPN